jgi:hypothetical protein
VESWSFFEPPPTGGNPDSTFFGNRLQTGLRGAWSHVEATGALQAVFLANLPPGASGPGPLGTGALYYSHAGDTDSGQVYPRYLHVTFKNFGPGLRLQVGRMAYASGSESTSTLPKLEAVKRTRLTARLIGEFEWSLYQRGFDGLRFDVDQPAWHGSVFAARPTQGGFEPAAGRTIDRIDLFAGSVTVKPGPRLKRTEVQVFGYGYVDDRELAARPDNTGRPAARVDVSIATIGASLVGAWPTPAGELDVLAWGAWQTGSWYEQSHRGSSLALEVGHQWSRARGAPWVRGGYLYASGDDDPADARHATFFQMIPTVRKFSYTASYSQMNLRDAFVELSVQPARALRLNVDLRHLSLAEGADRWYSGSGATKETGTFFGFGTRASGGATSLGTVVEGTADVTINQHLSLSGFLGTIDGGAVVANLFQGGRLVFGLAEARLAF